MIYQIAGTQPFLAAVCLFLKGDSQNKSYVLVCPCTFNEDLFFLCSKPAGSIRCTSKGFALVASLTVSLQQQKNLFLNVDYLQNKEFSHF